MAWIKVTDPQGHPLYLCIEQMVRIRPCIPGGDFLASSPDTTMQRARREGDLASARSIIDLVSGMQAVQETPDGIMELINSAGRDKDKVADDGADRGLGTAATG